MRSTTSTTYRALPPHHHYLFVVTWLLRLPRRPQAHRKSAIFPCRSQPALHSGESPTCFSAVQYGLTSLSTRGRLSRLLLLVLYRGCYIYLGVAHGQSGRNLNSQPGEHTTTCPFRIRPSVSSFPPNTQRLCPLAGRGDTPRRIKLICGLI